MYTQCCGTTADQTEHLTNRGVLLFVIKYNSEFKGRAHIQNGEWESFRHVIENLGSEWGRGLKVFSECFPPCRTLLVRWLTRHVALWGERLHHTMKDDLVLQERRSGWNVRLPGAAGLSNLLANSITAQIGPERRDLRGDPCLPREEQQVRAEGCLEVPVLRVCITIGRCALPPSQPPLEISVLTHWGAVGGVGFLLALKFQTKQQAVG